MKKSILIVDDEVSILKFLRSNLDDKGYAVISASNGEEALHTIERELPDLIVLDVMMPKMDGFEVCRRLREWSQIPIIMLSARGDEKDKVKCLDLGADDYIVKPFGASELMARVSAGHCLLLPVPTHRHRFRRRCLRRESSTGST